MSDEQNATPNTEAQQPLPGVEPETPEVEASPEPTFSKAQVEDIIKQAEQRATAAAKAEFEAQQAAANAPADEEDKDEEPPKPKEENLLLQSQLEAERQAKADLEAKLAQRDAESLKATTMAEIAKLLAPDKRALGDPAAQQAMVRDIYAEGNFTFTDGKLSHPDLTAQPNQIISDFLAPRPWYQAKHPEGSGAAPTATSGVSPGTNGKSTRFDSSKFMDGHDALDAALQFDAQNAKG